MVRFQEILDGTVRHLKGVLSGNEAWRVAASLSILVLGFFLLDAAWRRIHRLLLEEGREKAASVFRRFLPFLRLASAGVLVRAAGIPLLLPAGPALLVGVLSAFLFALAGLSFLYSVISLLGEARFLVPPRLRDGFSEKGWKHLETVLRVLAVLLAAFLFLDSQRHVLPGEFLRSSWWRHGAPAVLLAALLLGGMFAGRFFRSASGSPGEGEEATRVRMILRAASRPVKLLFAAAVLYVARSVLSLPSPAETFLGRTADVLAALAVFLFLYRLVDVLEHELGRIARKDGSRIDSHVVHFVRMAAKVLVIVLGAVFLLQALTGRPLNALLAGLGIGGLAVALAAQDTLKNLFGSFMIMLDRPFAVGDRIIAGGVDGVVEKVGFRSTRIRTFPGHLVSIPNDTLASAGIENVGSRPGIRRLLNVTITYDTPPDRVEKALSILREILRDHEGMHPDYPPRVHFSDFNDVSLNILVIYWYFPDDYWKYMEFSEKVNMRILRAFEAEGIEFAFPTTTAFLAQDNRRPLTVTLVKKNGGGEEGEPSGGKGGKEKGA